MSAAVFDAVFRRAETGIRAPFTVRGTGGGVVFDPAQWCGDRIPGDAALLAACTGPTLDVGCGPGRLTAALAAAGRPALGIDVSAAAVRLAGRRGAPALRRDVFGPLPGAGRWAHLLLADGNIGIGGDPPRLLRRCRDLVARDGRVHVELALPGTTAWAGPATAQHGAEVTSMPWAAVAVDDLGGLAVAAALRVLHIWTEAGRWFATLTPR